MATEPEGESFGALIDELLERGYHYLVGGAAANSRAARFVNDGIQMVLREDLWPFLEDQASGPAPLTIPELGTIRQVLMAGREKPPPFLKWLNGRDPDATGEAICWRLVGSRIVTTWPVDESAVLSVEYWREEARLVDRDQPCRVPAQWSHVVLDCAGLCAAKDARDWDNVAGLKIETRDGFASMRDRLLDPQYADSDFVGGQVED